MYLNFDKHALAIFEHFAKKQYPFKLKPFVFELQNQEYYQ